MVANPESVHLQRWQSIETAPRDGTKVLLWARLHDSTDASLSFMIGQYDISFGWVATSPSVMPIVATHWMPLRAPTEAG
jgi:Protein of unknown function (DUF551)